jgi:hypothetical protein
VCYYLQSSDSTTLHRILCHLPRLLTTLWYYIPLLPNRSLDLHALLRCCSCLPLRNPALRIRSSCELCLDCVWQAPKLKWLQPHWSGGNAESTWRTSTHQKSTAGTYLKSVQSVAPSPLSDSTPHTASLPCNMQSRRRLSSQLSNHRAFAVRYLIPPQAASAHAHHKHLYPAGIK